MYTIEIKLVIKFFSRWHIGAGAGRGLIDRIVIRDTLNRPFIPGSTLKGLTRQSCEDIALGLGLDVADPHDAAIEVFADETHIYIIDRLFGSRFRGECLYFRNAVLNNSVSTDFYFLPMTRTKIDRYTGTVVEKHLFTVEYTEPVELHSSILGFHRVLTTEGGNSLPIEYALLIAGLRNLNKCGGDKSTGKGRLKIELNSIKYNGEAISLDDALSVFVESEFDEYYKLLREEANASDL
jgi:CRISPR/Cas system CMR subunit Cmr4 (Cas7 group RAMP superfamily)